MVHLLLQRGAAVHANDDVALRKAAERGKFDNVALLLHAGADIHALDDDALCRAAGNAIFAERGLDTIRLLLTCGANVHAADDAPLINAAGGFSADAVALLLDHGASIHAQGDRALHTAIQRSNPDIVRLLLDRGADLHAGSGRALKLARSIERAKRRKDDGDMWYRSSVDIVQLLLSGRGALSMSCQLPAAGGDGARRADGAAAGREVLARETVRMRSCTLGIADISV